MYNTTNKRASSTSKLNKCCVVAQKEYTNFKEVYSIGDHPCKMFFWKSYKSALTLRNVELDIAFSSERLKPTV